MKWPRFQSVFIASFFVLLAALLLQNSYSYLDPDFGWHLRVGQDIVRQGQVPQTDQYDYTMAGRPWVDHEWLFNVGLYGLYQAAGYGAVTVFFAAVVLLTWWLLLRHRFVGLSFDLGWFLIFGTIGLLAITPHLGVRLQEITLLGLVLELIIIDRCRRFSDSRQLAWLLPLFALWANLHAGFLIGLAILFWWPLLESSRRLLSPWQARLFFISFDRLLPWPVIGQLVGWAAAAAAVTLATPYGYKLYGFLTSFGSSYYLLRLQEWLPFYIWPVNPLYLVYLGLVAATLLLLLTQVFSRRDQRLDLWWLSLTALFFLMSLRSRRHLPLLAVVSLPYLVDILSTQLTPWSVVWQRLAPHTRWLKALAVSIVWAVALLLFLKTRFVSDPFAGYCDSYPCRAVATLQASQSDDPPRIFNYYGWGGYLTWQWSGLPLFIDGRQPQQKYGNHSLLEEYDSFYKEGQAAAKLEEHGIDLALLKKTKPVGATWLDRLLFDVDPAKLKIDNNNLINHLKSSPGWQVCYEDAVSLAFCRKSD